MAEFEGSNLTCVRGERIVFAQLSFSVRSGDALVLVGPNGAGKSSLLRLMAGLLPPVAGRLSWNGRDVRLDADAHRRRLRYVGHADAVKPAFTVRENLEAWAQLWGGGRGAGARSESALDVFGLARLVDVPARFLSAGQRRRLALARLLVAPAVLWLLDEPKTALDGDAAQRLDRAIASHRRNGGMLAVALHGDVRPPDARLLDLAAATSINRGEAEAGCGADAC